MRHKQNHGADELHAWGFHNDRSLMRAATMKPFRCRRLRLGAMGSAALYQLAGRGGRCWGLDAFARS